MAGLDGIRQWIADLGSLFFPRLCEVCDRPLVHGEDIMCLDCRYSMPTCDIHNDPFNSIHKRLLRHVPVERAAAYFHYSRNSRYANLILSAKYRNRPRIMQSLASEFAAKIAADGFFDGIDLVVPVPMHRMKRRKRGYNQTDHIADGVSKATGIAVSRCLTATRPHSTQTNRGAYSRWLNSRDIYRLDDTAAIEKKHILLVDDVITTGATLAACCEAIHTASPDTKISILTLAATELQ